MLEREELDKLVSARAAAKTDCSTLAGLAQAALKADAVTGDPSWDTYCSYIQRAIDVAKQQRGAAVVAITSPQLVDESKVTAHRNSIFQMDERIRCLEWVVTMPAEIKRVGSIAKEKLAAMDIASEGEENANAA